MIGAEADVGVGGEVDDEVGAGDGFGEGVQVEQVMLAEGEVGVGLGAGEELDLAGGEVIDTGDGVAIGEKAVGEGAADEAGCAGDEYVHAFIFDWRRPGGRWRILRGGWRPGGGGCGRCL